MRYTKQAMTLAQQILLPFIYVLSALILQNPSFVTDFFRNFARKISIVYG